ncbi:MAG: hypothetical protein Q7S59_08350 [Sulfurimonas sp.]|nr:hypothetical protein [Sulfurimonas sp.]
MKKIIFAFLLLPLIIYAKSHLISPVPMPKTYILDLDPYPCSERCMQEYLDHGMIFSFLSHANSKLENSAHEEIRVKYISTLNLGEMAVYATFMAELQEAPTVEAGVEVISGVEESGKKVKIAMLLPYKIVGKYAASTTNAALAYLMTKNYSFELKSYKIENESTQEIQKALAKIQQDGFEYVIAPLTQEGADVVSAINPNINIFFPTINKNDSNTQSRFLYFGGIDYRAQSDLLIKEAVSPLVIFYDQSAIGSKLALYEEEQFKFREVPNKRVVKYSIPVKTTNLSQYLEQKSNIQNASFFINTPIVKTGMIMSQLTLYDVNAVNILSTQINYDPLLLSMTQYEDRKNMIVANSITHSNNLLIEANALLANDIVYDWINYTTTLGVDYFFSVITQKNREYDIVLENNQIKHEIELLKPTRYRFVKNQSNLEE